MENEKISFNFDIVGIQLVLVLLKVFGLLDISWVIILLPMEVLAGFATIIVLSFAAINLVKGIVDLVKEKNKNKEDEKTKTYDKEIKKDDVKKEVKESNKSKKDELIELRKSLVEKEETNNKVKVLQK